MLLLTRTLEMTTLSSSAMTGDSREAASTEVHGGPIRRISSSNYSTPQTAVQFAYHAASFRDLEYEKWQTGNYKFCHKCKAYGVSKVLRHPKVI